MTTFLKMILQCQTPPPQLVKKQKNTTEHNQPLRTYTKSYICLLRTLGWNDQKSSICIKSVSILKFQGKILQNFWKEFKFLADFQHFESLNQLDPHVHTQMIFYEFGQVCQGHIIHIKQPCEPFRACKCPFLGRKKVRKSAHLTILLDEQP